MGVYREAIRGASRLPDLYESARHQPGKHGARTEKSHYPATGCEAGGGDCLNCSLRECVWDECNMSKPHRDKDGNEIW
jgi:hypothetical protein